MDEPETIASLRKRYVSGVAETTREILDEGRTLAKVEELALVADRYADGEIEDWRSLPDAPKLACGLGCTSCCHVPVGVMIPEAILIASTLIAESTEEELTEILDRVRLAEAARSCLVGPERDRKRHPCPMLDKEQGTCTIYEFRPLNCRGWNSLDVASCETYFDDPSMSSSIPIDGIQRTISQSIAMGMAGGLESQGLEHSTVDLAVALRIILEDLTAIDRWLGREEVFRTPLGDPHRDFDDR